MNKYSTHTQFLDIWISKIPAHWQAHKMKHLFSERSEKGYPNEPLLVASQNMGVVPKNVYGNRTVEAQKDLHLLKLVRVGDFVISLRSFQGGLEYAYYQGIISPAYTILIPHEPMSGSYFRYLAKSKPFIGLLTLCVTGIREGQNIDYAKLKNHLLPVPPHEEQDQIVRFLDWKVSSINKLINIKKKEIKEIDALKRSMVSHAITRGLTADAPMKYSGVKWLGDIPQRWYTVPLYAIAQVKSINNASYFAFTATPKNKTLETFGVPYQDSDDVKHRPFHVYTMKQAIQEGFILDVLQYYTPIDSFYKLMKTVEDDPMFDKKRAQKKLRSFVESDSYTIAKKAAMMVDHFHEQVIAKGKIGGQARAMVVTSSIPRCIEYYYAINKCLADRRSPYKTIIAFSGENKYQGQEPPLTSAGLNGFPDAKIPKEFKKDPYRILIVADMFQTGFDEPLLHTMYVDKMLYDIKAVQTLSRLNRCCPKKYDTFVLDFANKPEIIQESFSRYYRTTILSGETDPNKLYDLVATMEEYQVFSNEDVERLVNLYLDGADRDKLDPTLDACTAVYKQFDTDDQIKFKSAAKAFVRTYGFLGAILPYGNADWERLSIFLNLLIPKLPSPREDDLSQGILETIDLESYRNEAREVMSIRLEDTDTEVAPVPAGKVGHIVEPEMDLLSVILSNFNDMFGNINWNDADNVRRQILEIPAMVSKDEKYQNAMKNSDEQSARLESERALQQVIFSIMADNMELFKQFQDNPSFKKWLSDLVFNLTYNKDRKPYEIPVQNRKN